MLLLLVGYLQYEVFSSDRFHVVLFGWLFAVFWLEPITDADAAVVGLVFVFLLNVAGPSARAQSSNKTTSMITIRVFFITCLSLCHHFHWLVAVELLVLLQLVRAGLFVVTQVTAGEVAILFETVAPGTGCSPAEFVEAGAFSSELRPQPARAATPKTIIVKRKILIFMLFRGGCFFRETRFFHGHLL
jgi:hypothetical protein